MCLVRPAGGLCRVYRKISKSVKLLLHRLGSYYCAVLWGFSEGRIEPLRHMRNYYVICSKQVESELGEESCPNFESRTVVEGGGGCADQIRK